MDTAESQRQPAFPAFGERSPSVLKRQLGSHRLWEQDWAQTVLLSCSNIPLTPWRGWREEPTEEIGQVQQEEREAAAEFKKSHLLLHKQGSKRRNGTGGDMANKADLDFLTTWGQGPPGL